MSILGGRGGAKGEAEENVFWTTMADLMLGLAIIFMTMFALAMTGFTQDSVEQKQKQIETAETLIEELKKEEINAEVDDATSDVKISDIELFEVGSYTLSDKGKAFLNKLGPIYINTVYSNKEMMENVENIVIQGHTDKQQFAGVSTKEEQFIKNMDLSTKRANAVAEQLLKTNYDKQYTEKLIKMVTVEGKSFTEPVYTDGKEDFNKSRRVELRLKVKRKNLSDVLFGGEAND